MRRPAAIGSRLAGVRFRVRCKGGNLRWCFPMSSRSLRGAPSNPGARCSENVPQYASDYETKDWDVRMEREPVVIQFPEHGMQARDLILGIRTGGASRAFLYDAVVRAKVVKDRVGDEPVLLVVGPDGVSVRAFRDRIAGVDGAPDFYRIAGKALMLDSPTGSEWNFQGCAVSGKSKGQCLERVPMLKDYWFDWRNYNPQTTIWGKR